MGKRRGKIAVTIDNHDLSEYALAVLKGYALGMSHQESAKRNKCTAGSCATSLWRTCNHFDLKRNPITVLAFCLVHELLTMDDVYERTGYLTKEAA